MPVGQDVAPGQQRQEAQVAAPRQPSSPSTQVAAVRPSP